MLSTSFPDNCQENAKDHQERVLVGKSEGKTGSSIQENGSFDSVISVSTPLRLTGGGDSSFDKNQEDENMNYQGNLDKGLDTSISDSNCTNDILSFVNQDNTMSEQDIRDVLFEAGYSIDAINDIITSKAGAMINESANQTLINESLLSESESVTNSAYDVLREIRVKNVNKVLIGTLNINSFASKFVQLREIIGRNLDILTIQETKLDPSFPSQQFALDGYSEPYRLDRNRYGGGVLIYVREDIPSKLLRKHNFTKNVEGMFIEINLRKTKLLFFGGYRSEHKVYVYVYVYVRISRSSWVCRPYHSHCSNGVTAIP